MYNMRFRYALAIVVSLSQWVGSTSLQCIPGGCCSSNNALRQSFSATKTTTRISTFYRAPSVLFGSSSSGGGDNNKKTSKHLSNSERERREEEFRRKQRKEDVVINKTSAKKGAKDYPLDPKATEEEWLRQASQIEQQIFRLTEEGMEALKSLRLKEADRAFQQVFELKPNAYLWQAGIVKFYLGDLVDAAAIFKRNAELFETKFGGPASEERIWRDACELKFLNSLSPIERRKLLEKEGGIEAVMPRVAEKDNDDVEDDFMAFATAENRKVIKLARELFTASILNNRPAEVVARAQLMSLGGGGSSGETKQAMVLDRKMRKLNSWFYLGLHHDVIGEEEDSQKCLKMALKLSPGSGKSSDIVQTLPLIHMTFRNWFDDDPFEADPLKPKDGSTTGEKSLSGENSTNRVLGYAYSDPVVEASIMEGVRKMKHRELKEALRIRGLKTTGSKEALQERLFYSLMDDAGFQSGFAP